MAFAVGMINGGSWINNQRSFLKTYNEKKKQGNKKGIFCSSTASMSLTDQYKTLRIQPGATETEVKKAFRKLALQYHPDVCKGNNCGVQFHQINQAYDVLLSFLRGEINGMDLSGASNGSSVNEDEDDSMEGIYYDDSDLWDEWMGWEGAGTSGYSSQFNPHV